MKIDKNLTKALMICSPVLLAAVISVVFAFNTTMNPPVKNNQLINPTKTAIKTASPPTTLPPPMN
jgi:hypothetical protein